MGLCEKGWSWERGGKRLCESCGHRKDKRQKDQGYQKDQVPVGLMPELPSAGSYSSLSACGQRQTVRN